MREVVVETVIEIRGLRKVYGGQRGRRTVALESLDLDIQRGGVYGFLGPNGAGKTTAIRCVLGLVAPTEGSVRLLGADVQNELPAVLDRVGALVESPKFFPSFTGRRNLELLARVRGVTDADIDAALVEVGLADRADDRFGAYSLGMKQRLAVAGALLKRPEVLVLDEPANGLDPAGIRDMRDLIRRYGDQGNTVLVSSHQLSEIQLVCDSVAIVNRGRLIASGRVDDVLEGRGGTVLVTISDPEGAIDVLAREGFAVRRGPSDDTVVVETGATQAEDINRVLAADGRFLRGLRVESASLESVFLELTDEPEGAS
ncbi:MAG: ATP-binding cassette domain-containing protein [Acidimicrobiia bacterium]|nr:ATP-binding cassette domain-containing protein [Acidimicrobiia bacterium]